MKNTSSKATQIVSSLIEQGITAFMMNMKPYDTTDLIKEFGPKMSDDLKKDLIGHAKGVQKYLDQIIIVPN